MGQASKEYHLARYHRIRQQMLTYFGEVCASCGSKESLEIDHIDPTTKSFSLSDEWGRPWADLVIELDKCQILCKVCHKIKSDKEQTTRTHGTYAMYRRGKCRCQECTEAGRKYMREWASKARSSIG